ncbi:hypothetical protein [Vibrio natriegens]|uniref:hypothetical protein n=1 Tax=Vibrio natriegens TaxID=691 RepID=UPI001F46636D|nr:hypothetical protein [Vibrio natriegens]MDX6028450.1 hypothetical protein [Vibrio natriegens NBRC 15636 = ATCC 14048 = DSM 759]UUI13221.1 hypothetical protein NP431_19535 [Vibrio natriegens]WRS50371.1 hypothetical protein VER99_20970 [Vibrio natriegens NBRC 15636 = ATCC 14048 = DSM 759]
MFSKRKEQVFKLKPHYEFSVDKDTGVIKTSLYCASELMRALKGVALAGQQFITRVFQWQVSSSVRFALYLGVL